MRKLFLILFIPFILNAQNLILFGDDYQAETKAYITRVEADGGVVINKTYLDNYIKDAKGKSYYTNLVTVVDANFGIKKDANNKVLKVYDLLGIKDYAQSDTSKAPSWVAASLNGLAGLRFDGVNDYLATGNLTVTQAQPFTGIILLKSLAANSSKNFIDNANSRYILFIGAGVLSSYSGATLADTSAITTNSPFIYSTTQAGASSKIYKNNTLKMTGNSGTYAFGSLVAQAYYMGAGSPSTQFTNIIIYHFEVESGSSNISDINTFLNSYYLVY